MADPVPGGTVTFLFSDVEGSTRLLQELGDAYGEVLARQRRILRDAAGAHGGTEVDTQGDAFFFAFARARDAAAAAAGAQLALRGESWPHDADVRVRMGLHTGEPAVGEEGYVGIDVHRAARICSAAHGGQVLVSETTRALLGAAARDGFVLRDLGPQQLKDLDGSERLYQLVASGLDEAFPAPRTERRSSADRLAETIEAEVERLVLAGFREEASTSGQGRPSRLAAGRLAGLALAALAVLALAWIVWAVAT